MSESDPLDQLIADASAALENSADGHLSRAKRRDIVDALGDRLGPSGPPSNAIGYLRRVRLAVLGVEKVKPIWSVAFPDDEMVDLALDLTEQVAIGDVSVEWATRQHGNFWTHCDDLSFHGHGLNPAVLIAYGAAQTVGVAIWDWSTDGTDDDSLSPEEYDPAFLAAAASTGGLLWRPESDKSRRLEFWKWWMHEAIPHATNDALWNHVIPKDSESP